MDSVELEKYLVVRGEWDFLQTNIDVLKAEEERLGKRGLFGDSG